MANILVLSAGIRNKIIQYFKKAAGPDDRIIATDMSKYAPAIYEADKFYLVPPITAPDYIDSLLEICKKENISGIVSLMDDDLSLLAQNSERFKEIGTVIIGSSYELCERSINKWDMFCWLVEHGYKTAKSYIDINLFLKDLEENKISFPVFVKPTCGGGSNSISKISGMEELLSVWECAEEELMIQEFMNGPEYGIDAYIDMINREVVSVFIKEKLTMRSGETHKSVSFKDDKLFALIEKFITESGYLGQIDIDVFKVNGEYYISEVNPRFGGGYPHAYECGCDHMKLIFNNLSGIANQKNIGNYKENVYLFKYNEVMVKEF